MKTYGTADEKKRQTVVFDRLKAIASNLPAITEEGRGVAFFGPTGTGKTSCCSALLRAAYFSFNLTFEIYTAADLINRARARMNSRTGHHHECEFPKSIYVIDDLVLPSEMTTFGREVLFNIVDERYRNGNAIWITANVSTKDELVNSLGDALADRLLENVESVFFNWPSYRPQFEELRKQQAGAR